MNAEEREDTRTYKVVINMKINIPSGQRRGPIPRDGGTKAERERRRIASRTYRKSGQICGRVRYGKRWMA
jgi:hypothetical protein